MLHRLAVVSFVFTGVVLGQSPATRPSPDQAFEDLRRQVKQDHLKQLSDLRELGERRLSQLVELRRDGDFLRIDLRSETTDEPLRFTLLPGELPGRADIRASQDSHYVTADIQVGDFGKPGEISRLTSVSLNPLSFSIACFIERTLGSESVQLFQTQDGSELTTRLLVQVESQFSSGLTLQLETHSFAELRKQHGREVQQYLAPVLRDLGCERALFAPPLALAQQALGIGSGDDSQLLAELEPLLQKLDSPDFRTRHTATQELRKLDRQKVIALSRADRSRWSLNRISAVDSLLASSDLPVNSDLAKLRQDPVFLIDCLYLDDRAVRREAARKLDELAGKTLSINPDDPVEKRLTTIDRLVDRFIPPTRIEQDQ